MNRIKSLVRFAVRERRNQKRTKHNTTTEENCTTGNDKKRAEDTKLKRKVRLPQQLSSAAFRREGGRATREQREGEQLVGREGSGEERAWEGEKGR